MKPVDVQLPLVGFILKPHVISGICYEFSSLLSIETACTVGEAMEPISYILTTLTQI